MRGTGIEYTHIHVYTSRLVMREVEHMDGILEVLGTVWSRLCSIPMRVSIPLTGGVGDFKSMCASVRKCVIPSTPECVQEYAKKQWFGAIVRKDGCVLLSPIRGDRVWTRYVDSSLEDEMVKMGLIDGSPMILPLPPKTNVHNKSMVTLDKIVENLMASYSEIEGKMVFRDVTRLPSQALDIHRLVCGIGSGAMLEMRDGFRRLWNRSFDIHGCYRVLGDEIIGKLY